MRSVPLNMERIWRSGEYVGDQRPIVRVTVQHPVMDKLPSGHASARKEEDATAEATGNNSGLKNTFWKPGDKGYGGVFSALNSGFPTNPGTFTDSGGDRWTLTMEYPNGIAYEIGRDPASQKRFAPTDRFGHPLPLPAYPIRASANIPATSKVAFNSGSKDAEDVLTVIKLKLGQLNSGGYAGNDEKLSIGYQYLRGIRGLVSAQTTMNTVPIVARNARAVAPVAGTQGTPIDATRNPYDYVTQYDQWEAWNRAEVTKYDVEQAYTTFLLRNQQIPKELNTVKAVTWQRDVDTPVATMTLTINNNAPGPDRRLDQPGYYNANRGKSAFSKARWSHSENAWSNMLAPDNIIKTFEGYGCDKTQPPERDPHLVQTGVWIISSVTATSDGLMTITCSDVGRILQDQMVFPPVIPKDFYPLTFETATTTEKVVKEAQVTKHPLVNIPLQPYDTSDRFVPGRGFSDPGTSGSVPADAVDNEQNSAWTSWGFTDRTARRRKNQDGSDYIASSNVRAHPYFVNDNDKWEWIGLKTLNENDPPIEQITIDVVHQYDTAPATAPYIRYNFGEVWAPFATPSSPTDPSIFAYYNGYTGFTLKEIGVTGADLPIGDLPNWDPDYRGQNERGDIQGFTLKDPLYNPLFASGFNGIAMNGRWQPGNPVMVGTYTGPNGAPLYVWRYTVEAAARTLGQDAYGDTNGTRTEYPLRGLRSFRVYSNNRMPDIYRPLPVPGQPYQYRYATYISQIAATGGYAPDTIDVAAETTTVPAGPPGSNPGWYSNYTDIVKMLCAWGGFVWPDVAYIYHSDGRKIDVRYDKPDPVLGTARMGFHWRVWGDFQQTAAAGESVLDVDVWDKKSLLDGIQYCRDIVGAMFKIDEHGGACFRLPNLYQPGNFLTLNENPGFTTSMYTLDENQVLMNLSSTISSANVREGVFVSNGSGELAAISGGYNPNPTGLRRWGGWTDSGFLTQAEMQRMADMITIRQLMTYRQDQVQIPGFPAIQIDDQVRVVEEVTGESYVHYVKGISSSLDMEEGTYTFDLTTHWLGDDPRATTVLPPALTRPNLVPLPQVIVTDPQVTLVPLPRVTYGNEPPRSQSLADNLAAANSPLSGQTGAFSMKLASVGEPYTPPNADSGASTQQSPVAAANWAFSVYDLEQGTAQDIASWLHPANYEWQPRSQG